MDIVKKTIIIWSIVAFVTSNILGFLLILFIFSAELFSSAFFITLLISMLLIAFIYFFCGYKSASSLKNEAGISATFIGFLVGIIPTILSGVISLFLGDFSPSSNIIGISAAIVGGWFGGRK